MGDALGVNEHFLYVPVRANDEDITVHGQIFAIATADVQAYGAGLEPLEESLNDGPWLFAKKKKISYESFSVSSALARMMKGKIMESKIVLYTAWRKNARRFARRRSGRALPRTPRRTPPPSTCLDRWTRLGS